MTLAIVLSFCALLLLAALALLWSRWPAWLKALLVLGVTGFYFYANEAVHSMWGWPSSDALPARFNLLAAVIDEPTAKSAGGLYLWVTAIDDGKPAAQPRAYKLAYTKDSHSMLSEGMKKVRQGISQVGTAEPKRAANGFPWLSPGSNEQDLKIRDMPVPQLPEK